MRGRPSRKIHHPVGRLLSIYSPLGSDATRCEPENCLLYPESRLNFLWVPLLQASLPTYADNSEKNLPPEPSAPYACPTMDYVRRSVHRLDQQACKPAVLPRASATRGSLPIRADSVPLACHNISRRIFECEPGFENHKPYG